MKPWKAIVFLTVCTALIGGVLFFYIRPGGPKFQGKTAEVWFDSIKVESYNDSGLKVMMSDPGILAIQQIGPPAVPFLLNNLTLDDLKWEKTVQIAVKKHFPNQNEFVSADEKSFKAFCALKAMGPAAKTAVKTLCGAAQSRNLLHQVMAIQLLGKIHSEPQLALPILQSSVKSSDQYVSRCAITALADFGADAKPALPMIVPLMQNKSATYRLFIAAATLRIDNSNAEALAVILKELNGDSPANRQEAIQWLSQIGTNAAAAIPSLLKLHNSTALPQLKLDTAEAIKKIDPETAAKAGIK